MKQKQKVKEPHPNSCNYCTHCHEDSESSEGYTLYSYLYCGKNEMYGYLKSFPFKKEMKCFELHYWAAIERDEELKKLHEEDMKEGNYLASEMKSYVRFREKYYPEPVS